MSQPSHSDSAERARLTRTSDPLAAARGAVANGYTLIAVLGQNPGSGITYLAREDASGELVAVTADPSGELPDGFDFVVARELDPSLPGPGSRCPGCGCKVVGWTLECECGHDLSGITPESGSSRSALRERVRQATAGEFEILGSIPQAGGGDAYFGEQVETRQVVALRMHAAGEFDDGTVRYDLSPTEPLGPLEGPAQSPRSGPVHFTPAHAFGGTSDERPAASHNGDGASGGDHRLPMRSGFGSGLMATVPTPLPDEQIAIPKVCPSCGAEYETGSRFCPKDGMALRPKGSADPLVGRVLAERYHVLKKLGEGGMGRVYLGEHVKMNRQCAIKVMNAQLVNDAESARRFAREASNAARIIHPNVAAVFDYGESDGLVYIVMEYVDGEPLSRILEREKSLPPHRALDIARQVADGLGAAHELGIVHRDLKPDNIMIGMSRSGREVAKVVDFGIAKAAQDAPPEALTRTGLVIGTPEYMSPEQLLGDPVDERSDLYSLGCILYQMLTGSSTFEAPTREQMVTRRLTEDPPHVRNIVPELPDSLDRVVSGILARNSANRYSSAYEVREMLRPSVALGAQWDPAFKPTPRSAPTVVMSAAETTQKLVVSGRHPIRRSRMRMAVAAGGGVVLLATGFAVATIRNQQSAARPDSAVQAANGAPRDGRSVSAATDSSAGEGTAPATTNGTAPKTPAPRTASTASVAKPPTPQLLDRESTRRRAEDAEVRRPIDHLARAFAELDSVALIRYQGMSGAIVHTLRTQTGRILGDKPPELSGYKSTVHEGKADVEFTIKYEVQRSDAGPRETWPVVIQAKLDRITTGWQIREVRLRDSN